MALSLAMGSLLGAGIGFLGQRSANKANSAQAARSMAFQKEMAQNAHQYEVADLKKAGLNPLLSGTGGKGASASGGAQAKIENEANSAMTSKLLNAQANAQNAQTLNTQEQTKLIKYGLPGKTVGTAAIDKTLGALNSPISSNPPTSAKQQILNFEKQNNNPKPENRNSWYEKARKHGRDNATRQRAKGN